MEIIKSHQVIHRNPSGIKDYPYALSCVLQKTDQLFLSSEKVKPGHKASAPHSHSQQDEIIYVLKNELYAFEGDEEVLLREGDCICFRSSSHQKHYLENRGQEDAEFLIFKARSESDVTSYHYV